MTDNRTTLLDPHELAEAGPPEAIRLPVELIDPNPRNPRGHLVELDALADSIKEFSLMQPILVRRLGDRYELLAGHRRVAAYHLLREREPLVAEWRTIPAVVRAADDERSYLMLVSSQVHSKAWRPREEAAALESLVLAGLTLKEVGERLNHSESWASKRLRIYSDAAMSALVQTGQLAAGVAEELLAVRDFDTRRDLARRAASESWSKEQARAAVRNLRLSTQLAELGRRAREMAELLSMIQPHQVSMSVQRDLMVVRGRIDVLSGRAEVIPTIEQAMKAAGVNPNAKPRRPQKRRRMMPPPA